VAKTILIDFKGTDNVSATAKTVESSIKKVGAQSTAMGGAIAAASTKSEKHLTDLGSQFRYMSLVAGLAAGAMFGLTKSFIDATKSIQDAQLKLGVFALSSGENLDSVNQAAQNLYSQGLVPLTDASTAYANLLATGLGLEKSTKLINTFMDAIVVGKESINDTFGDALVKATLGIRIFQERQADASGINTQFNKVFQEFGKTVGKTTAQLSNAEKHEALFNFYMKEGTRFTGAADLASQTLSGTLSKLSANFTILKATLGNALLPAFGTLTEVLQMATRSITDFAREFPGLSSVLIVGAIAVTTVTAALAGFAALLPLLATGLKTLGIAIAPGLAGLISTVGWVAAASVAVGGLIYIILKATGQWDKWSNSMKNLTVKMKDLIKPMQQVGAVADDNNKKLIKQLVDLERSIALTTRDFSESMAKWARDHDATVRSLVMQIASLDRAYAKATDNIKKNFSSAMSSMSTDHARRTEDLKREIAEEVSKGVWADQTKIRNLQRELARENEDYAASIDEKTAKRDEDLADEKSSYDDRLSKLQESLAKELKLEQDNAALVRWARTQPILDEIRERTRAYTERLNQYTREIKEITTNALTEQGSINMTADALENLGEKGAEAQEILKKRITSSLAEYESWRESLRKTEEGLWKLYDSGKITHSELVTGLKEVNREMDSLVYQKYPKWMTIIGETLIKLDDALGKAIAGIFDFSRLHSGDKTYSGIANSTVAAISPLSTPTASTTPQTAFSSLSTLPAPISVPQGLTFGPTPYSTALLEQHNTKYPTSSLEPGTSNSSVMQLQKWLIEKGYAISAGATGFYGEQTKSAVAQLQSVLGVAAGQYAGYYGPGTLAKLREKYPKGYKMGGVIPGSPSTPVPIIAHGGETVLPAGVSPVTVNINNPIVREDSDIRRIADMVRSVLANEQRFRHVM